MNGYSAYPVKRGLGWWCMLRLARDARPHPVMEKGDKPKVFETAGEAWAEATKHLLAFMNGHEIRGERFDGHSTAKSRAELLFKTRPVAVGRKAVMG